MGSGRGGLDPETMKDLKFMLNSSKKEVDMLKKMFQPSKITLIDDLEQKAKEVDYEIKALKAAVENSAQRSHVVDLREKFAHYTPLESFNALQTEYGGFVNRDEYNGILRQIEYMQKDLGQHCSKREIMERFAAFSYDVTNRLEVRPTIDYLRKLLTEYDRKMDTIEEKMQTQMTRLDNEQEQ